MFRMRAEYIVLAFGLMFSFLAFMLTMHGMQLYGGVELNPVNNFWISNNLAGIGFVVNSLLIIALFKYGIMKAPEKYRYLCVGIFFGTTVMDFAFDALSIAYVSI